VNGESVTDFYAYLDVTGLGGQWGTSGSNGLRYVVYHNNGEAGTIYVVVHYEANYISSNGDRNFETGTLLNGNPYQFYPNATVYDGQFTQPIAANASVGYAGLGLGARWGGDPACTYFACQAKVWYHISFVPGQPYGTPTPTPTATFTPTFTPTPTPTSTPTRDRWWTGNSKNNAYGIRANISAPSQAPYLVGSGESSYVTTATSDTILYWIQTGWRYYLGYDLPDRYVERFTPAGYLPRIIYGHQNWGDVVEYRVEWLDGTTWCAFIDNVQVVCTDIGISAPQDVNGHSEVHVYPQNELNTFFSNVYYRSSTYQWIPFDQPLWHEDAPYSVDKIANYEYRNYGP
jgi:hypothetical protein